MDRLLWQEAGTEPDGQGASGAASDSDSVPLPSSPSALASSAAPPDARHHDCWPLFHHDDTNRIVKSLVFQLCSFNSFGRQCC